MNVRSPAPLSLTARALLWITLVATGFLGVLPFRSILTHYPWRVDSVRWVTRGATDVDTWSQWVFAKTHFVGYRPVAAITYSINYAMAGFEPEIYRITDMGLQVGAVIAVGALFRALVGRTDAWMLLPAFLFAAHPVSEEIVPLLARRSYSLSVFLAMGGLALWIEGLRKPKALSALSLAGTLGLLAALLTNEVTYVLMPLLPFLAAWIRSEGIGKALERCIPPYTAALCAVGLRFWIMGWAGGYDKHYFAITTNGRKALRQVDDFNLHRIVGAAFEYVWLPIGMPGTANPMRDTWRANDVLSSLPASDITLLVQLGLFTVVAYYTWHLIFGTEDARERRIHHVFIAWMLGYGILFGLSRTWFWRQGYPLAVPVVLAVAWHLRSTVQHAHGWRWLRLAPQFLLLGSMLWHSPMVRGMSDHKMEARIEANALLKAIDEGLLPADLSNTEILFFAPGRGAHVKTLQRWLQRLHKQPGTRWKVLATGRPAVDLVVAIDDKTLTFGKAARISSADVKRYAIREDVVELEQLAHRKDRVLLVYPDSTGAWKAKSLTGR